MVQLDIYGSNSSWKKWTGFLVLGLNYLKDATVQYMCELFHLVIHYSILLKVFIFQYKAWLNHTKPYDFYHRFGLCHEQTTQILPNFDLTDTLQKKCHCAQLWVIGSMHNKCLSLSVINDNQVFRMHHDHNKESLACQIFLLFVLCFSSERNMAVPVLPVVANLYIEELERRALRTARGHWYRYVDDT